MKPTFIKGFISKISIMDKRKMKIKGFTYLLLIVLLVGFIPEFVSANQESETATIHFFEQRGCPDCARQKEFLDSDIKEKYPEIEIIYYSIMSSENQDKFHEMMKEQGVQDYHLVVPTTFIGENYFQNFYDKDKELIIRAIEGENVQREIMEVRGEGFVNIPFLGEININTWSIPALALVIGSVDGLNVCSIGSLILILTLVLTAFNSRKKIIFYGGLFILTTVLMYGGLIFAWTALFHALANYIGGINFFVGIAALFGGAYFFKKFIDFYRYGPACDYSSNSLIVKATKKLQNSFATKKGELLLISGVVFFALIVTLIELPCSIGLPIVYAGVLADQGFSLMTYIFYVGLYLFFYMFIELVIFGIAVATKEIWFAESKWITWVYLFGALVLFILSYNYLIGF